MIKPPQRAHASSRANDDDDAPADIDARGAGDERRDAAPETCAIKHPRARPLLLCALALHLALTLYALPLSRVLGPLPLGAPEILGLYQQTLALVEAGRLTSVYDPTLLAGVTTGTPGALATPLYTLGVQLLTTLGLTASAAFNLVTLLLVLTGPLFVWRAAHVLTHHTAARAITLLLAVLVWHLDSSARLSWAYSDDPTFALGAALSVLTLATLARALSRHEPTSPAASAPATWWPALALVPLCPLVHPASLWILAVPTLALYARARARLARVDHLRLLILLGITLALASVVAHIVPPAELGRATPLTALADLFEVVLDTEQSGNIGQRTMFRALALVAAIAGLLMTRRESSCRLVGAITLSWLFGLAYAGAALPTSTGTYRFIVPATLVACVLAGPPLARVCTSSWLRARSRATRGLLLITLLLILPRAGRTLLYFVPELASALGVHFIAPAASPSRAAITGRMTPPAPALVELARVLDELPSDGRVLVASDPASDTISEYLAAATRRSILGEVTSKAAANVLLRPPLEDPEKLAAFIERYDIRYVVDELPVAPALRARRELLQPLRLVAKTYFIHERRGAGGVFLRGQGRVLAATPGRVEIAAAHPEPGTQALTLRFRFAPELRCTPSCQVVQADNDGLLRVVGAPILPERFTITDR